MSENWTEVTVKLPVDRLDQAEAALYAVAPLGLYIEDYSDLEQAVKKLTAIDLIEDELLAKDRESALLHVYFPPDADGAGCVAAVRDSLTGAGLAVDGVDISITTGSVAEEDWANNWKQYFKPFRVGKGILIRPEWEDPGQLGDALLKGVKATVSIDPGMAFGTGGHATTRLCLELIEDFLAASSANSLAPLADPATVLAPLAEPTTVLAPLVKGGMAHEGFMRQGGFQHAGADSANLAPEAAADAGEVGGVLAPLAKGGMVHEGFMRQGGFQHVGADVLDVGCGSGILSIAAVLLGARSALGVDVDKYAVRNARENARRNGLADEVRFIESDLTSGVSGRFHLITANIVADVVINLLADARRRLRLGGALILSGIIDEREGDVLDAARANGFVEEKVLRSEGWTALMLKPVSRPDINVPRFFASAGTGAAAGTNAASDAAAGTNADTGEIVITHGDDIKHIQNVLRRKAGDHIVVCDGAGTDSLCEITLIERYAVAARVLRAYPNMGEPPVKVSLFQSLPRSDKFDYIVQKCTEAGVYEIIPVISEFTQFEKRALGDGAGRLLKRWRRIAYEAAKQSGRGIVPAIRGFISFTEAVDTCTQMTAGSPSGGLALIPYENEVGTTLKSELTAFVQRPATAVKPIICVFIGPEGGYSPTEISYAECSGAAPVTLGPRIYRTETAGLAALCGIMYEFEG